MRNKSRTLNEWMLLITECRQSGLSDTAWCEQNDIPATSFYNAVSRLRKKACSIPKATGKSNIIDLAASKQEVVKVEITSDTAPIEMIPQPEPSPVYLDNSHTIEIAMNGLNIRLTNSASPLLLDYILNALRTSFC